MLFYFIFSGAPKAWGPSCPPPPFWVALSKKVDVWMAKIWTFEIQNYLGEHAPGPPPPRKYLSCYYRLATYYCSFRIVDSKASTPTITVMTYLELFQQKWKGMRCQPYNKTRSLQLLFIFNFKITGCMVLS